MAANFTSQAAAVQARYMLNTKNVSAKKSGGQRYDIELSGWLHVTSWSRVPLISFLERRRRNTRP